MRLKVLFLFLLFTSFASRSQPVETLRISQDTILRLKNWELYFIQDQHATIGNTPPLFIKKSLLDPDSFDLSRYTGVCWFRKVFKVDSSFRNKHVALQISIIGAADIFLNKKRIKTIGTIGYSEENETLINSDDEVVGVTLLENNTYELLVRYSNHEVTSSYTDRGENFVGINIFIKPTDSIFNSLKQEFLSFAIGMSFLIFFFTLWFVHLVIYIYNRKEVSNLYYSCFCFFISLLIVSVLGADFSSDAGFKKILSFLTVLSIIFVFTLMPFMFRSFFKMTFPKWYKIPVALSLLTIAIIFIDSNILLLFLFIIIVAASVESVRAMIIAFRKKLPGVRIIGFGLSCFMIMICALLISSFMGQGISIEDAFWGMMLLIFLVFSVISIPVSITILLANNISHTNKSLAKKLIEVEELSEKSLSQEKEKQQMLANQNTVLEKQVSERTHEITEQKKVIEEKNKDIIDSINYAKRIQTAMLPDEAAFKAIFTDSFILYQPRDIVSGDFYYATEINGNKLIVAADCTGHGVPGALMSMVGCNIINKLTHENKIIEPKLVLETLHTELRQALKQDVKGSTNRDGMDIAAVMINDKNIIYAGANRPLIYFDKNRQLQEVKATKTPVGGSHIESVNIEQHIIPKGNTGQLYLFSDGFADQFGGSEGKKLMISKFKLWLSQIAAFDTVEQHGFLSKNFKDWKNNTEQVDDVMVIGIKIIA